MEHAARIAPCSTLWQAQPARAVEMLPAPAYAIRGSFLFASLRGRPRFEALLGRLELGADLERRD